MLADADQTSLLRSAASEIISVSEWVSELVKFSKVTQYNHNFTYADIWHLLFHNDLDSRT